MSRSKSILNVLAVSGISLVAFSFAEEPQQAKEKISLRAVKTDSGAMVEMTIGDIVVLASALRFQHDGKPETVVEAREERISLESGQNRLNAKLMEFTQTGGLLSWKPSQMQMKLVGASGGEDDENATNTNKPKKPTGRRR